MKFSWVLAACLLFPSPEMSAQQNTGALTGTPEAGIPFQLANGFLIFVEGRIGPLHGLRFVLDTGATQSVVARRIAERLALPRQIGKVFNFDRYVTVERATFPDVQVGALAAKNLPMMVGELGNYSEFAESADAIIGLDLLSRSKTLRIDYGARTVTFELSNDSGDARWSQAKALTVRLLVQGRATRLVFDTGLQGILLYEDRLRKRFPEIRLEEYRGGVHVGHLRVNQARLPGLLLGASESAQTVFLIQGPSEGQLVGIDGYLGIGALNAKLIEVDFEQSMLRWR